MRNVYNRFRKKNLFKNIFFFSMNWLLSKYIYINGVYLIILLIWICEWLLVFEYFCGEYYVMNLLFPFKITFVLGIGIIYWIYLWALIGWRRVQYGRFTRNERQLWAKGYAAFWIIEFVTIFSFIVVFAWLSWGPLILVPRYFIIPRRGIILEFILYSYLIFLTYVAKLNMRWNIWNIQLLISLSSVMILSYLLWRDIINLVTRDNMLMGYGTQWRRVKLTGLVYAMSHEWWLNHTLGSRTLNFKYISLHKSLETKKSLFDSVSPLMEYELNLWLIKFNKQYRLENMYLYSANLFKLAKYYSDFNIISGKNYFYTSRVGFIPKRLAIWELLFFLKIWHQLIILVWWILYIFKLKSASIGSYQLLSICYFNIYCCYLLGLIIYSLSYFVTFELVLRFRPNVFSILRLIILIKKSMLYIYRIIISIWLECSESEIWQKFRLVN